MSAVFVPPPPGMPPPPPGMPLPPGFTQQASSRMPPEMLAQKSQKWVSLQKKRYGEKRKGGYVDMGKQVCAVLSVVALMANTCIGPASRARPENYKGPRRYE